MDGERPIPSIVPVVGVCKSRTDMTNALKDGNFAHRLYAHYLLSSLIATPLVPQDKKKARKTSATLRTKCNELYNVVCADFCECPSRTCQELSKSVQTDFATVVAQISGQD